MLAVKSVYATGGQQAEQQQQGGGKSRAQAGLEVRHGPDNEGMAMVNVKEKADCLVDDTMARIKFGKGCAFIQKGKPFVTEPWRIKGPKKDEHGRASKA